MKSYVLWINITLVLTSCLLNSMEQQEPPDDKSSLCSISQNIAQHLQKKINAQKTKIDLDLLLQSINRLYKKYDLASFVEILKICLKNSHLSFLDLRNHFQETALHCCAQTPGLLMCTKIILQTADTQKELWELLTAKDQWGENPLHWAARNGYEDIAAELIAAAKTLHKAARLIFRKNMWGQTALHVAAFQGNITAIPTIIKTADLYATAPLLINVKDNDNQTALDCADHQIKEAVSNMLQEYCYH